MNVQNACFLKNRHPPINTFVCVCTAVRPQHVGCDAREGTGSDKQDYAILHKKLPKSTFFLSRRGFPSMLDTGKLWEHLKGLRGQPELHKAAVDAALIVFEALVLQHNQDGPPSVPTTGLFATKPPKKRKIGADWHDIATRQVSRGDAPGPKAVVQGDLQLIRHGTTLLTELGELGSCFDPATVSVEPVCSIPDAIDTLYHVLRPICDSIHLCAARFTGGRLVKLYASQIASDDPRKKRACEIEDMFSTLVQFARTAMHSFFGEDATMCGELQPLAMAHVVRQTQESVRQSLLEHGETVRQSTRVRMMQEGSAEIGNMSGKMHVGFIM